MEKMSPSELNYYRSYIDIIETYNKSISELIGANSQHS